MMCLEVNEDERAALAKALRKDVTFADFSTWEQVYKLLPLVESDTPLELSREQVEFVARVVPALFANKTFEQGLALLDFKKRVEALLDG